MIVTVPQRRAKAIERLRLASTAVIAALRAFAAAVGGGRYVVFGSFARGDIVPTSDFDVIPTTSERSARDFAEKLCRNAGLEPDVHLASEVSDALMIRVRRDGWCWMSDARWIDVDDDIAAAAEHFSSAQALLQIGRFDDTTLEGYRDRMTDARLAVGSYVGGDRAAAYSHDPRRRDVVWRRLSAEN